MGHWCVKSQRHEGQFYVGNIRQGRGRYRILGFLSRRFCDPIGVFGVPAEDERERQESLKALTALRWSAALGLHRAACADEAG